MPVTSFDALLEPLFRVFGKGRPLAAFLDTSADYARALGTLDWLDDSLLAAAVDDCVRYLDALPTPKELIAVCRDTKQARDLSAARAADRLLPPPAGHVVEADALDESDPYACTPEERERWAREDQWCRGYARTLDANPPPHANAAELDAWKRNWSVANWPKLTPQARRAKERRIAAERAAAIRYLAVKFGRDPENPAQRLMASIPARPRPEQEAQRDGHRTGGTRAHAAGAAAGGARGAGGGGVGVGGDDPDPLVHVPDGDAREAADWLAGLGTAGTPVAGSTRTQ